MERRYAIKNQIYYIVLWDKQQIVVAGNVYICFHLHNWLWLHYILDEL